jgi:hypothetical protein
MAAQRDSSGRFIAGSGGGGGGSSRPAAGDIGIVTDRDLGYNSFMGGILELSKLPAVFVGIRGGGDGDLLVIAASNEFGTADGHIPERSYLRSTVDEKRAGYEAALTRIVRDEVDGKSVARVGLERLGAKAVGDVQKKIAALREPPNAPSTIAKKGSSNPLIEDGRLRQSIEYEVRVGDVSRGPSRSGE